MKNRVLKFEYGFQSVNHIVKKVYELGEIPRIAQICDVWNDLPIVYVRPWTGAVDANGVHIFQGDIMQNDIPFDKPFVVNWNDASCSYEFDDGFTGYSITDPSMNVVGNIYENPEMLRTERKLIADFLDYLVEDPETRWKPNKPSIMIADEFLKSR